MSNISNQTPDPEHKQESSNLSKQGTQQEPKKEDRFLKICYYASIVLVNLTLLFTLIFSLCCYGCSDFSSCQGRNDTSQETHTRQGLCSEKKTDSVSTITYETESVTQTGTCPESTGTTEPESDTAPVIDQAHDTQSQSSVSAQSVNVISSKNPEEGSSSDEFPSLVITVVSTLLAAFGVAIIQYAAAQTEKQREYFNNARKEINEFQESSAAQTEKQREYFNNARKEINEFQESSKDRIDRQAAKSTDDLNKLKDKYENAINKFTENQQKEFEGRITVLKNETERLKDNYENAINKFTKIAKDQQKKFEDRITVLENETESKLNAIKETAAFPVYTYFMLQVSSVHTYLRIFRINARNVTQSQTNLSIQADIVSLNELTNELLAFVKEQQAYIDKMSDQQKDSLKRRISEAIGLIRKMQESENDGPVVRDALENWKSTLSEVKLYVDSFGQMRILEQQKQVAVAEKKNREDLEKKNNELLEQITKLLAEKSNPPTPPVPPDADPAPETPASPTPENTDKTDT